MRDVVAELPPTLSGRRVPVRVAREQISEDLRCCHAAPPVASVMMAPPLGATALPLPALQAGGRAARVCFPFLFGRSFDP